VVWVRPELVVEIACNNIQESPQYPSGMALRFARVKGYRPDKEGVHDSTIAEVRRLFDAERGA
jgi:DNA ligase-1